MVMTTKENDRIYSLEEMPTYEQLREMLRREGEIDEKALGDLLVSYDAWWEKKLDLYSENKVEQEYYDVAELRDDLSDQILAHEQALSELGLEGEIEVAVHAYHYVERSEDGQGEEEMYYVRAEFIGLPRLFNEERDRYRLLLEVLWKKWEEIQAGKVHS